jgi:aminoglycoside phosphotransferase (APT) family kinase protein
MSRHEDNIGTMPVRDSVHVDTQRLAAWMADSVEGFAGPLRIEEFKGGQSNPTYKLVSPDRAYVLRRKPPGRLLRGAHAVEREARVMSALATTGFPVPRVFGLCEDDEVIGTAFFVMDMVEGRIFWDPTLPDVPHEERRAYFDAMNATLAQLHAVDPDAVGLSDYGRPGSYLERQIAIWSRQYLEDDDAGRDLNMDRLVEWLPANVPGQDETAIVHGDFRCDNLIFHAREPRVVAVLDWELSTLGHPLSDFAYHAMMYRMPASISAGLAGVDHAALGIPSEEEYVADYCRRTGRTGIPDYDFYIAFNLFRIAAILHGIKGRAARGNAASSQAMERAGKLPELAALAWQQAQRAGSTRETE